MLDGDCGLGARGDLEELVEESAVLEHGRAHVFSGDLRATGALGNGVGGAVVFDDAGVVDRDVGGALLEVDHGIAAGVHERGDEFVGFDDGAAGVINEAGLHELPLVEEALAFGGCEVVDLEALDALFTSCEGGLGFALGATLEDRAFVFGAEAGAQAFGLLSALADKDGNNDCDDHDKNDDANDESWVRRIELHRLSLLQRDDAICCKKYDAIG